MRIERVERDDAPQARRETMPTLESRSAMKFHDQLFWYCLTKVRIRKSTALAEFMTRRGHPTIQQSANRYLRGETLPSAGWLKDFMRFAGLEADERRDLFAAYVAQDPDREALLNLQSFVQNGDGDC